MKILCPSCERLADLESFRLDAGTLVISCSRCGVDLRIAASPTVSSSPPLAINPGPSASANVSAPSARVVPLRAVGEDPAVLAAQASLSADPFAPPPGRCPKCIAVRPERATTCGQCGLTYAHFQADEYRPSEPINSLWRQLLSNWNDVQAHDRFLSAAMSTHQLAMGARLYQIRCVLSPDDLHARRGRDEILRLATASGSAGVKNDVQRQPKLKLVLALVGLFVAAVSTIVLVFRLFSP